MDSPIHFIGGQVAIALGVFMLSKTMPWSVAVGVWLVAEGVISAVWAVVSSVDEAKRTPWHGGQADVD